MITLTELFEKLKEVDEVTLIELLELNSASLVDKFQDEIEERFDKLTELFEDDDYAS